MTLCVVNLGERPTIVPVPDGDAVIVTRINGEARMIPVDLSALVTPRVYEKAIRDGTTSIIALCKELRVKVDPKCITDTDLEDYRLVDALLDAGAGATSSLLFNASRWGYTSTVESLLAHGADPAAKDLTWYSPYAPFYYAAANGRIDIVRVFLKAGVDVHAAAYNGLRDVALCRAAAHGHRDVVELLLDHGADLHVESKEIQDVPLNNAAKEGHLEVVKLLVQRGAVVSRAIIASSTEEVAAYLRTIFKDSKVENIIEAAKRGDMNKVIELASA